MKIDLDKLDLITDMEHQIEKLIKIVNLSEYDTYPLNKENKVIFALTITTILYKEKIYIENIIEKIKVTEKNQYYKNILEDIIVDLNESIQENDLIEALETIKSYGEEIQIILSNYFKRTSKNYIMQNEPIELIQKQQKTKEILQINPFIINQLMKCKKTSNEEKIIKEILELFDILDDNDEINSIKIQMLKRYNKQELKKIILFIISNVYQEIKEDKTETKNRIKDIIESEKTKKEDIIEHFIKNNQFSSECLEYFLIYNLNIKKGRLEELKTKPSYKYIMKKFL